jgi:hypothetical protein
MEEQKIQALHDTLAKLKKTAGLGVASHYNFGKIKTKQVNGETVREDGLPNNPLYFPFVKEGTFDPSTADASKFGDGRAIKRNFDDCNEDDDSESSNSSSDKKSKKRRKKEAKEKKKAEKKVLKLEAKRQAKLEAKRQAKLEEKRRGKLHEKKVAQETAIEEDKLSNHGDDRNDKNKKKKDDNKKQSKKDSRYVEKDEDVDAIKQGDAGSTPPTIEHEDAKKKKKKSKKKDKKGKS